VDKIHVDSAMKNSANLSAMLVALLSTVLYAKAQRVQPFTWKSVDIEGMGWVTGLVIQPTPPYDIYIRTDVGGTYRFDRNESKWIPLMDSLETQAGVGTESIAIDPRNASRVYAVINRVRSITDGKFKYAAEVMLSEDRGAHWHGTGFVEKNVYAGSNDDYRVETGERLAVDPTDPNILYFASRRNGLWKSVRQPDGTHQWNPVNEGLPAWRDDPAGDTFVLFAPSAARDGITQTIYVGVHSSGVWRSIDSGHSWENLGGPQNPGRGAVASDGTLYVSFGTTRPAAGSVGRYRDGTWTDITPDDKTRPYTGIGVDPTDPAIVMVGRDDMVWRSTSAGSSWASQRMVMHRHDPFAPGSNPSAPAYYLSNTDGASGGVSTVMIDPENPKHTWWINGWGAARTDDVTAAQPFWAWQMKNLEELCAVMVRVPPKPKSEGGADLVTMAMDMIGFRIENRNQVPELKISPSGVPLDPRPDFAWQAKLFGPASYPVPWPFTSMGSSLDYSYQHPDTMAFVGHLQWLYWPVYGLSNDGGRTWKAFPSMPKERFWDNGVERLAIPIGGQIAMSSANPLNFVWAPTWGTFDGIRGDAASAPWPHVTVDGGKTWRLCRLAESKARHEAEDANSNDQAHHHALPRSSQNATQPWVSTQILAADRNDPKGNIFYYVAGSDFFTSLDGGLTWKENHDTGFPADRVHVTVLSNPAKTGDVWVAFGRGDYVQGTKLFHSSDAGKTFSVVPGVQFCDKIAFGQGDDAKAPYLYMLGRLDGQSYDAIFKSEDMGASWNRLTDPSETPMMDVVQMEGDMRTKDLLYLALDGRGFMYGTPAQ
jgi:photosystem II stability/assembly factor-like uncharacterized protein